jgi:hypothetical protein
MEYTSIKPQSEPKTADNPSSAKNVTRRAMRRLG